MTQTDIERKQLILIDYIQSYINETATKNWLIKAEYSTNDNDNRVIVIQETQGRKDVFFGDCMPLFNYYMFDIYGLSIQENKNLSLLIGNLIGKDVYVDTTYTDENNNTYSEKWQIIFKQFSNPQALEYLDIRRVGYNATMQCVVNKVFSQQQN